MRNRTMFRIFITFLVSLIAIFGFSGIANAACVPQDAVETTYKTVLNPEYVPAVEEESHVETVIVKDAYSETILVTPEQTIFHEAIPATVTVYPPVVVPATYKTVHHEATYKKITHEAVYGTEYEYKQFITGKTKWRDTATWNGYDGLSWGWYYTGNTRPVVLVEEWCETVVDVPAWDEQVVDVAEYTIPGYEVTNDDAVEAWTEIIPAEYAIIDYPAETREQLVIDVEAQDAIGEEFITVVDVQGTPAVVCEPEVTPTPTETPVPVIAEVTNVVPAAELVAESPKAEKLAATGGDTRMWPYALGAIMVGIVSLVVVFFARRWEKNHYQSL